MKMMLLALLLLGVAATARASADGKSPESQPYPRVVAHRGLSGLCPENTMPAFGAAVSLGVQEIELDVWGSKDKQLVVCHDATVDRTSNGKGAIRDLTWEQIRQFDAGSWFGESWSGIRMPRLEDVFEHFAGRVVINVHLKEAGTDGWIVRRVCELARKYKVDKHIYIAGGEEVLKWSAKFAPDIERCCLAGRSDGKQLVEKAVELGCQRLQFRASGYDEEAIKAAHAQGIICNLFYADTYDGARKSLDMGIDAVLTNYANIVLPALEK